jgi:hypothetical protein
MLISIENLATEGLPNDRRSSLIDTLPENLTLLAFTSS